MVGPYKCCGSMNENIQISKYLLTESYGFHIAVSLGQIFPVVEEKEYSFLQVKDSTHLSVCSENGSFTISSGFWITNTSAEGTRCVRRVGQYKSLPTANIRYISSSTCFPMRRTHRLNLLRVNKRSKFGVVAA